MGKIKLNKNIEETGYPIDRVEIVQKIIKETNCIRKGKSFNVLDCACPDCFERVGIIAFNVGQKLALSRVNE